MVLLAVRGDQIMGTEENHDSLALRKLSSGGAGIAESVVADFGALHELLLLRIPWVFHHHRPGEWRDVIYRYRTHDH